MQFAKKINFGAYNFSKLIALSRTTKTRFSGAVDVKIGFQPPFLLFACRTLCVLISIGLFCLSVKIYYIRRRYWVLSVERRAKEEFQEKLRVKDQL